jgi:hypothetical protein
MALGLALTAAVAVARAFAGQAFEQTEATVSATDPSLAQPDAGVWDVLNVRDMSVRFKVAAATLDTTASALIHLQTNATLAAADWRTIETYRVTEGIDFPPLMGDREISADGDLPMLRYVRWLVEFSAPAPNQSVRFEMVGVGRE